SDCKDRLHGEERLRGIVPGTGIIGCYACRDRILVIDSNKENWHITCQAVTIHFAAALRGANDDEREIPVVGRLPNDHSRETERDECCLSAVRVGGDGTCSTGLSHARSGGHCQRRRSRKIGKEWPG